MALYYYKALDRTGKKSSGSIDATSTKQVREQLMRKGLYVISVDSAANKQPFSWNNILETPVKMQEKIDFTKQFGVLLRAGVPLVDALDLLIDQTYGSLKKATMVIRDGVKEGKSLADMMLQFPKLFDTIYIQLVRAGEASGSLEKILDRLSTYLEQKEELRRRVSGALMYPLIQFVAIILVAVFMMVYLVPMIIGVVNELLKGDLPLITRMVKGMSEWFIKYYLWLIIAIVTAVAGFFYWKSSAKGSRQFDALKLRIPKLNHFVRLGATVRFSRTLGLLLESGVSLADALDIVCSIVDNKILEDTLRGAREQIIKQGKVTEYLEKTNMFPQLAIYLINTGEQTGALDKMLLQVADQYERELMYASDKFVTLINPIMLIFMALVVITIIIAILYPMMGIMDKVSQGI